MYLEQDTMYMNPVTGSVASSKEWTEDFKSWVKDLTERDLWEIWDGGESALIAVELVDGDWVEID